MTNSKITQLGELPATPSDNDYYVIVDVSDSTMAGSGTNKKLAAKRVLHTNGTADTLTQQINFGNTGNIINLDYAIFGTNTKDDDVKLDVFNASTKNIIRSRTGSSGGITMQSLVTSAASHDRGMLAHNLRWDEDAGNFEYDAIGANDYSAIYFRNGGDLHFITRNSTGNTSGTHSYSDVINNTAMAIIVTGEVGIGTDAPSYKLDVSGQCHASSFPTSSDERLKENINKLELTDDLKQKLKKVNAYTFTWKDEYVGVDEFKRENKSKKDLQVGFIAQEVKKAIPQLVTSWKHVKKTTDNEGKILSTNIIEDALAVDYTRFIPILWEAVKELYMENANLKERIETMEGLYDT